MLVFWLWRFLGSRFFVLRLVGFFFFFWFMSFWLSYYLAWLFDLVFGWLFFVVGFFDCDIWLFEL